MTRDDIIRMAREAGVRVASPMDTIDPRNVYLHELERFAALVAAAEREACARVCEQMDTYGEPRSWLDLCAADIRARGEV